MIFVSYSGHTGSAGYDKVNSFSKIPNHNIESLENLIHRSGIKYGFLDLKNIPQGGDWLKEENWMYPTFWNETKAKWDEIYDGIFYIDVMIPENGCFFYPK